MGKNPTDRGKRGTKRSMLTEGGGVPVGLAVEGENRHDFQMARATIERLPIARPEPIPDKPQGMCLDQGGDDDEVRELLAEFRFTAHICARREEAKAPKQDARFRARRWVVQRMHSCMNRFRRVLIPRDTNVSNDLAGISAFGLCLHHI